MDPMLKAHRHDSPRLVDKLVPHPAWKADESPSLQAGMSVRLTSGHRWRIGQLRRECGKARDARGREGAAREPSGNTVEIEGRSGRDVLQARLGQAAVARSAQT